MAYYFERTLTCGFEDAVRKVTEALSQEGFGIVSDIDVSATMRAKLDLDF
jgi:uncharacterized protein (DUF302 family)